jgi:hypothetical protein
MPYLMENVRSGTRRTTLKDWLIHMNNARPQNSGRAERCIEASKAERLPHPVGSPDMSPSDFFLFEETQRKLSDYNCESREDLLNAITEILAGVDSGVLLNVFKFWVNRLK